MSDNYYLKLRLGDRVIETGSSCMTWQRGTVVQSSVDPGSLAVKWDTDFDGGKMTTSITHGTMLIGDVVARMRSHDDLIKERDALRAELAKSRGLLVTAISIIRNNVNYTKSPAWDSVRMAIKDIDEHLIKKGE